MIATRPFSLCVLPAVMLACLISAPVASRAQDYNTADGIYALAFDTTGGYNSAFGYDALDNNTTGFGNTAAGFAPLLMNATGNLNTAVGYAALQNVLVDNNTAVGAYSLYSDTSGTCNTGVGFGSLGGCTTGSYNIGLGYQGGNSVGTGDYNIEIGNKGAASDSGVIRIGTVGRQTAAYILGINGVTSSGGVAVYIDSSGKLGTLTSSRRFKFDIKDIGAKSDKLMDLRPVEFRYKEAAGDGTHPIQYGLIAEEVAKVYPDLVQYDKLGKPFTVYYQLLTPMMLNELQKAHQQLAAQRAEFSSLKATVQKQSAALQTESASLQSQGSEMASLRHTVQLLLVFATAIVSVALVGVAYVLSARIRRVSSLRTAPVELCAS